MAHPRRLQALSCHQMLVNLEIMSMMSISSTLARAGKSRYSPSSFFQTDTCRNEQAQPNLQKRRQANVAPVKTALPVNAAVRVLSGAKPAFTPSCMTPGMPATAMTPAFRSVSELLEDSSRDISLFTSPNNTPIPPPDARAIITYLQQLYGAIGSGPAPVYTTLPPLDIGTFTNEGGTTRAFAIDGFQLKQCDDFIRIGTSLSVSHPSACLSRY